MQLMIDKPQDWYPPIHLAPLFHSQSGVKSPNNLMIQVFVQTMNAV